MKSSGLDGITVEILQHHWATMKQSVMAAILHFFYRYHLIKSLNFTYLTMIPKKLGSTDIANFRLITCTNVIY